MEIRIKDERLKKAAGEGMDAFLNVFVEAYLEPTGGEITLDTFQNLNGEQITLLAYHVLHEEVMDGGFIQLIQNGYGPFIFDNPQLVQLIDDGKYIDLFEETRVKAIFTPGHSNDSITWVVNDVLFTGDSYIPGVKTVTNLPHSDKILASQSEIIIKQLAENRTVYPGHAPEQI